MAENKKHPGGRPSEYKKQYVEQAFKLCLLGATDKTLADFFEVSEATINTWKIKHPEFLESLRAGKDSADANVAHSLYKRATGYTYDSEKIMTVSDGQNCGSHIERVPIKEHCPPDVTATIFWLKNRKPSTWRDKQDVEHQGNAENPVVIINAGANPYVK